MAAVTVHVLAHPFHSHLTAGTVFRVGSVLTVGSEIARQTFAFPNSSSLYALSVFVAAAGAARTLAVAKLRNLRMIRGVLELQREMILCRINERGGIVFISYYVEGVTEPAYHTIIFCLHPFLTAILGHHAYVVLAESLEFDVFTLGYVDFLAARVDGFREIALTVEETFLTQLQLLAAGANGTFVVVSEAQVLGKSFAVSVELALLMQGGVLIPFKDVDSVVPRPLSPFLFLVPTPLREPVELSTDVVGRWAAGMSAVASSIAIEGQVDGIGKTMFSVSRFLGCGVRRKTNKDARHVILFVAFAFHAVDHLLPV